MEDKDQLILLDKRENAYMLKWSKDSTDFIEAYLYPIQKYEDEISVIDMPIGFCLIERKNQDTYETLYSVEDDYQGRGLGSELINFSKEMVLKLGAKYIKLQKLERSVEKPFCKGEYYDANLCLYLNHGFRPDLKYSLQDVDMICDLIEERTLPNTQLMNKRLKGKEEAYRILK